MTMDEKRELKLVTCPFCGNRDFDLPGLKYHLMVTGCEVCEETIDLSDDGEADSKESRKNCPTCNNGRQVDTGYEINGGRVIKPCLTCGEDPRDQRLIPPPVKKKRYVLKPEKPEDEMAQKMWDATEPPRPDKAASDRAKRAGELLVRADVVDAPKGDAE